MPLFSSVFVQSPSYLQSPGQTIPVGLVLFSEMNILEEREKWIGSGTTAAGWGLRPSGVSARRGDSHTRSRERAYLDFLDFRFFPPLPTSPVNSTHSGAVLPTSVDTDRHSLGTRHVQEGGLDIA